MPKLRTVLRFLVLLCLSGWLWIVVQPAEAQQTVSLSGRVTDSAGQAVPRVSVSLLRMPGWIWTDGQDTASNGSYRLSVPPGTYLLRIESPHGPLIPYETELTLSTNATHNIVLETGVTLSGQITGTVRIQTLSALFCLKRRHCDVLHSFANLVSAFGTGVAAFVVSFRCGPDFRASHIPRAKRPL